MAIEQRNIEVMICDAPTCDKEAVLDDEEYLGWFAGSVLYHHEGGGSGGNWHACRAAHIKAAVLAVAEGDE